MLASRENVMKSALGLFLASGLATLGALAAGCTHSSTDGTVDADASLRAVPVFVAHFEKAAWQLPEGLWEMPPTDGGAPVLLASLAPLGSLVSVTNAGATPKFGALGTATNTYTLGVTSDAKGDVYVGVGAAGAGPSPAPGVYRLPANGSDGAVWSLGSAATPPMAFPNGLDFVGSDLFVADSGGAIFKIDAHGTARVWSQDELLAPDQSACRGVVPLAVGANGIVHDAQNVYVTNTNHGRLLRIPILPDGTAGTVAPIVDDCASFAGADGLVLDKDGSFIVALNARNKIVRVTSGGTVSVLAAGAPPRHPRERGHRRARRRATPPRHQRVVLLRSQGGSSGDPLPPAAVRSDRDPGEERGPGGDEARRLDGPSTPREVNRISRHRARASLADHRRQHDERPRGELRLDEIDGQHRCAQPSHREARHLVHAGHLTDEAVGQRGVATEGRAPPRRQHGQAFRRIR